MGIKQNRSWHLIQCKPREEQRAKNNLENQGYSVFLPEINQSKKTPNGYIEVKTALFAGYIFIDLDGERDNWAPIRSTRGVSKIVSFGLQAAVVPTVVIETLKRQSIYRNEIKVYPFTKGEKVTITSGPFKDLDAIFDLRNNQERAWVFIELMGKWQRLIIKDVELNSISTKVA